MVGSQRSSRNFSEGEETAAIDMNYTPVSSKSKFTITQGKCNRESISFRNSWRLLGAAATVSLSTNPTLKTHLPPTFLALRHGALHSCMAERCDLGGE